MVETRELGISVYRFLAIKSWSDGTVAPKPDPAPASLPEETQRVLAEILQVVMVRPIESAPTSTWIARERHVELKKLY